MKRDKQRKRKEGHFLFWDCREEREKDKMNIEVELSCMKQREAEILDFLHFSGGKVTLKRSWGG